MVARGPKNGQQARAGRCLGFRRGSTVGGAPKKTWPRSLAREMSAEIVAQSVDRIGRWVSSGGLGGITGSTYTQTEAARK